MQCDGGYPHEGLDFAKQNYVNERKKYPYRGKELECRQKGMDTVPKKESRNIVARKFDELVGWEDKSKQIETFLKTENYYRVKPNNVRALKEALTLGPVAVSVRAENSP